MPETIDIPVDLPAHTLNLGPAGSVVIGGLATYGAVRLSLDVTRSVKAIVKARKANKESELQASTTK